MTTTRRHLLTAAVAPLITACGTVRPKKPSNPYEGRWEGKLENGLSALTLQFDFNTLPDKSLEFRVNAHDLFLATHVVQTWTLEGNKLSFDLPLIEGAKSFTGNFGGNTIDVESKATGEKIHMRRLGFAPSLPYKETGLAEMVPTARSVRAKAKVIGKNPALVHFYSDLVARLGIATSVNDTPGAGWLIVEDQPLPPVPKENPPAFIMFLSPGQARVPELLKYPCPLFLMLGESDSRFANLERATRQIAFDLREGLTKQNRKDYQISVVPKADATLRVPGWGKEYPRLTAQHIESFRRFLSRFEPAP